MKKNLALFATLVLVTSPSWSQDLDSEIDSEILNISTGGQTSQTTGSGSQPIYIQNQVTPTTTSGAAALNEQAQQQIQQQPQVNILASPLTKSRAEQMREARNQVEVETENQIAEKLEMSRIEDEKRRANVLFGDKFNQMNQQNTTVVAPQVVPVQQVAPVQAVAPVAPVVVPEKDQDDKEWVREEIRSAMAAEKELPMESIQRNYFSAAVGIAESNAGNVFGNYLVGATFGTIYDETYSFEGTVSYASYTIENQNYGFNPFVYKPKFVDTEQYGLSVGSKFFLLDGMIKPNIGGLLQYSYRTHTWSTTGFGATLGSTANSHAVDLGVSLGTDISIRQKWALGFDFKYFWNMASRVNNNNQVYWDGPNAKPLERIQYYTMNISAKWNF